MSAADDIKAATERELKARQAIAEAARQLAAEREAKSGATGPVTHPPA